MKRASTVQWTTRAGKRRVIKLYRNWMNLKARVQGHIVAGNGAQCWKGLPVHWRTWPEFRAWALSSGYCRERCSLDRIDTSKGYTPENCQWITVRQNSLKALGRDHYRT